MSEPTSITDILADKSRPHDAAWFRDIERAAVERAKKLGLSPHTNTDAPRPPEAIAFAAGLSPRFTGASLRDFAHVAELPQAINRLVNAEGNFPGLVLYGLPGRGKTRLACAIVNEWRSRNRTARFETARRLQSEVFGAYARDNLDATMTKYTGPSLLAVDDLGHEGKIGDASISLLIEVLDFRANHSRPTVVTTALRWGEAEDRYDASVISRLKAMHRLEITGPDRRQESAQ